MGGVTFAQARGLRFCLASSLPGGCSTCGYASYDDALTMGFGPGRVNLKVARL
jgi:hypothetical protein